MTSKEEKAQEKAEAARTKDMNDQVKEAAGKDGTKGETREAAAAAGGYNTRRVPLPEETGDTAPLTQPDTAAVDAGDLDDGRITSQEGREAAGPFTGTGNQDAMRAAGQPGGNAAHHADQREGADESAVEDKK